MASAGDRLHINSEQRLSQSILHHEQGGLHNRWSLKLLLRFSLREDITEEERAQVLAKKLRRREHLAALVCNTLEEGHLFVEPARHAKVLAALPWKHEGHGWSLLGILQLLQLLNVRESCLQGLCRPSERFTTVPSRRHHHATPQRQCRTAGLQGICILLNGTRQGSRGLVLQASDHPLRPAPKRRRRFRGKGQDLITQRLLGRGVDLHNWQIHLLKDRVCVSAANAERADTCPERSLDFGRPLACLSVDKEGRVLQVDLRVQVPEVGRRR
mmetsp:Transcript_65103/g.153201  ORF Transcript_65103/g.153201 Transcript_65103/m.153201 type:complete len:271 (-) Transcript_65103:3977-4789(-)